MDAVDEMKEWLERCSQVVQDNVTVITPEDIGQPYLLHISTNGKIPEFIPVIGHRQSLKEDRTVPRVCTAPTLVGCILGYASLESDFQNLIPDGKKENKNYRGGWTIYGLPFEAALRPNKKLVYDAATGDEIWLVSYSPETIAYVPVTLGKFFIQTMSLTGRIGKEPIMDITMYVEVRDPRGMRFSNKHWLKPGHWRINCWASSHIRDWKDDKDFTIVSVSKADYQTVKTAHAALLSEQPMQEDRPAYLSWA